MLRCNLQETFEQNGAVYVTNCHFNELDLGSISSVLLKVYKNKKCLMAVKHSSKLFPNFINDT